MQYRKYIFFLLINLYLLCPVFTALCELSDNPVSVFYEREFSFEGRKYNIEKFICKQMKSAGIPGLSVVIVKDDGVVYQTTFGFADREQNKPVDKNTLFEIASNSKAFTALGVLLLEKQGLIDLNHEVDDYIPWFQMKYRGAAISNIRIRHCLHHTSGIPFNAIGNIPVDNEAGALVRTVRTLVGKELDHYPGTRFLYSTINYDILGLIIETVSGMTFEEFIKANVIKPLRLESTYVNRDEAYAKPEMAKGYKLNFLAPRVYNAPPYRGNTPAGYFISDSDDIARWLKIQLLTADNVPLFWQELIEKSHIPDRTIGATDGASYAAGWNVYQAGGGLISHSGNNPNFSAYFAFRPLEKIGVAVLANQNSDSVPYMGQGIMNILTFSQPGKQNPDLNKTIDFTSFLLIIATAVFLLSIFLLIVLALRDIFKGNRKIAGFDKLKLSTVFSSIALLLLITLALYLIPYVLFSKLNWKFVRVWAPSSLGLAVLLVQITAVLFVIYYQLLVFIPKEGEKPFFPLAVISFISGFGNAFIVFTVNEALNRIGDFSPGLLFYFFFAIILYLAGQKVVRQRTITLTNNYIYLKRMELTEKILATSYYKIENMENGKIHAGLNNDTEKISAAPNVIIDCLSAVITLLCCFVYLGLNNIFALFLSIIIISLSAYIYFLTGKKANVLWEQARDLQNIFFRFINDLIGGYKELSLSLKKRTDFKKDLSKYCRLYKEKSAEAGIKFANVIVLGELFFVFVIGIVAFFFPLIFKNLPLQIFRTYIFIFLYITGPVNVVLNSIPRLMEMRVSWNRIRAFTEEINQITDNPDHSALIPEFAGNKSTLRLIDIEYEYKGMEKSFKIGPISYEFNTGEIIFITGGNGSGKTTLAKVLTGLYKSGRGQIYLNDRELMHKQLGEIYSNVFNDFYLFSKLYGLDYNEKIMPFADYKKIFKIDDKLDLNDGEFNTLKLSQGQRKRLALIISLLEDKKFFLFDEWAADQDPEFRKFFYMELLEDLKKRGKCIIAITHDDSYFHIADKILKMDMGKIV